MNIALLPNRFDVAPLAAQLAAHPVWNQHPWRTGPQSPHREVSDIWCRYRSISDFDGDLEKFNRPHEASWYQVTEKLPAVKSIASELMNIVGGSRLGGILITKIPAHRQVYRHVDGGWHAGFYEKYAVQIAGNLNQKFRFDHDEFLSPITGETFWFRNDVPHSVINNSDDDRITLICCIRK